MFRKTTATAAFFLISFPHLAVVYVVMLQGIVSMDQALSWWYLQANTLSGCLDDETEKGPRVSSYQRLVLPDIKGGKVCFVGCMDVLYSPTKLVGNGFLVVSE